MMSRYMKYPHIDRLENLRPNPEILLGKRLTFEEKRDGSNLCFWTWPKKRFKWFGNTVWVEHISSRNMELASNDLRRLAYMTDQYSKIMEFLKTEKGRYMVYAELIQKGYGATRVEGINKEHQLVIFDIWDNKVHNFLPYIPKYQLCYHWNLPVVERWAETQHATIESLYEMRDKVLAMAKEKNREGTVIKYIDPSPNANPPFIFAKEKLDIPPSPPLRQMEEGRPVLPPLPDSEINGEWLKLLADYGITKMKHKSFGMPEFVRRTNQAAKDANCRPPKDIFKYYKQYLQDA